jgi:hypothetical protein
MAANTSPIFPLTPNVNWGSVTTANTALDGTGTVVTIYTAGSNGSRADKITIRNTGTAVATVLRIFINNGSTNATPANNTLYAEISVPANTLTQTAASVPLTIPLNLALPASYKLNITVGTTIATALAVTAEGGDY